MNIGILGTGMVGRAHAMRLAELGHRVVLGTQDIAKTLAVRAVDQMGNLPFSEWQKNHANIELKKRLVGAEHDLFLCGNDKEAKMKVSESTLK